MCYAIRRLLLSLLVFAPRVALSDGTRGEEAAAAVVTCMFKQLRGSPFISSCIRGPQNTQNTLFKARTILNRFGATCVSTASTVSSPAVKEERNLQVEVCARGMESGSSSSDPLILISQKDYHTGLMADAFAAIISLSFPRECLNCSFNLVSAELVSAVFTSHVQQF